MIFSCQESEWAFLSNLGLSRLREWEVCSLLYVFMYWNGFQSSWRCIEYAIYAVVSYYPLLYRFAAGMGAAAAPMAAALNWVLKDGIGQFGGVAFTA